MQRLPTIFFSLLLVIGLYGQAKAQALAVHQAVKPAPAASAIIPGSPLAAIAGVPPAASSDDNGPSPFGTNALGLSITSVISHEAAGTVGDFLSAVRKSTALDPVLQWLQGFAGNPDRQSRAWEIAEGLGLTVLPAIILAALLRVGLAQPRTALVRRAAGLHPEPAQDEDEVEERPGRRGSILAWARRLLLAFLHLLVCLVPILGFGLMAGSLLGFGFVTAHDARLSIIGVANAYLFCSIVLELLRFLVAPFTAPLRLFHMAGPHARWLYRWVRGLLIVGGAGYGVISISEILDLPHNAAMVVIRILGLAFHIQVATMIWQSRKVVGGWIKGHPDPRSLMAGPRRRLGSVWHYIALFYVLAVWIAWAGGVQNAFAVLLRVVLFFMAALILGRLGWRGSELMLERIFPDPTAHETRHPNFLTRARAYSPLIRAILRIVIGIAMVAVILLGWHVNILPWLLKDKFSRSLISAFIAIIVTIAIAVIIWEIANGLLDSRITRLTAAGKTRQGLRLRTLSPMLKASFGTAIGLLAGLICLSKIGVNAAPLLAGAGVLGIAIGFGSQKLVQDIITGLFLLMEDTMQVGDVVTLAGMSGTVERLSIRTIRLRGGDGSVNIIPFSAVTTVTNQTRDFGYAQISVGIGYNENIDHACAVLSDIARSMRAEPTWGSMMRDDLQINGLDQFGANALIITAQIRTGPGQHWAVRREFSRRVVKRFAEEKIEIPYTK